MLCCTKSLITKLDGRLLYVLRLRASWRRLQGEYIQTQSFTVIILLPMLLAS